MEPSSLPRVRSSCLPVVLAAVVAAVLVLAGCTSSTAETGKAGAAGDARSQDLIRAAERGDLAAVRAAVDAGADLAAVDATGATALVRAAYGNHVDVAAVLVAHGADVNHQDRTQQSAYLIASSEVGDDPRLLDLTIANGAEIGDLDSYQGTALIRAAHRGYPVIVGRLIRAGVPLDHVNDLGWTALLEAVILGDGGPRHQQVVAALLTAGADRGIADRDGRTALAHARAKGQDAVARLLAAPG